MQRSLGFFVVGIAIGAVVTFAMVSGSRRDTPSSAGSSPAVVQQKPAAKESSPTSTADENKILLGDITTVPFQELYGILSSRSPEEVRRLAEQLKELPPTKDTKAKITAFFKAWAHLDAKAAFAEATSFNSAESKGAAIGAVINGADPGMASFLATSIADLPSEALTPAQRRNFLTSTVGKWSQADPVAAAKFLDRLPGSDGIGLMSARISIAQNWAAIDPQAALAWAQGKGNSPGASVAVSGAITGWWHADPHAAEQYVASHLNTLDSESVMALTRQIFGEDPQRAKEWINQLPSLMARRSVSSFVAVQLAASDPKRASEWAASLSEDTRGSALWGAISAWTRVDPQAAGEWMNTLTGGPRDDAVSAYSLSLSMKNPAAALGWVSSISDEGALARTEDRILAQWLSRSPGEATAWIQKSTLPDSDKARLLALPPPEIVRPPFRADSGCLARVAPSRGSCRRWLGRGSEKRYDAVWLLVSSSDFLKKN